MPVTSRDATVKVKRPTMSDFARGMWILKCVERAQMDTMQQKAALDEMLLDRSQWHGQLLGLGHLSILRLAMLPESFWRALVGHLARHFGWNLAVIQDVTRPETETERLERHLLMLLKGWPVVREYAQKGAEK